MRPAKARGKEIAFHPQEAQNVSMNRQTVICLSGLLALGACGALNGYYKPGVTVSTLERETLACETLALQKVPSSTQVRYTPPRRIPGRRICNAAGACFDTPDRFFPGETITYDPNDGLRKRVEMQCMTDKGYAPVSVPRCPDAIGRATPARATETLPNLNANSCVINNSDGTFQIVTRG